MTQKKTKTIITPGVDRVLVQLLSTKDLIPPSGLLIAGQLKAGENLLYGKVIASSTKSKYKPGMYVYYSEYSAAALAPVGKLRRGEITMGELWQDKNARFVVAEDDIMAFEEQVPEDLEEAEAEQIVQAEEKQIILNN